MYSRYGRLYPFRLCSTVSYTIEQGVHRVLNSGASRYLSGILQSEFAIGRETVRDQLVLFFRVQIVVIFGSSCLRLTRAFGKSVGYFHAHSIDELGPAPDALGINPVASSGEVTP